MAVAPKQKGLEILRKLVPLNTLAEGDLQRLLDKVVFEKLKKGETLFREGDRDNQNIYLLSGKVALLSGQREVDAVAAGSDTARFPLAHQIPRKFSVVARSRAEVVRVDNRLLGELIARVGRSSYEVSDLETEATDDWMSQLLQLRVFQQIPPENIQRVIMGMEEIYLNQGDLVVQQGEQGKYFYLINTGYCSVACEIKEGAEPEEVARLGPGDTFGEEALLSDAPRACTVSMLTDGLLLTLKKKDFLQYVKEPLSRELDYPQAASEVDKGSLWLDVRLPEVFEENHLPGSINLPLSSLRYQLSSLDSERSYIVYCDDGRQSGTAAYLLYEQGFHVSALTGGIKSIAVKIPRQGESGADIIQLRSDQETEHQGESEPQDDAESREEVEDEKAASEIEKLKQRLMKAERQSEDQVKRSNQLKQALDKAKDRLSTVEKKRTEIEKKYHRVQDDAGQLRETLEQKDGELRKLQDQATQVEVLSADKAVAESRIRELESEASTLLQRLEKAEQREQKVEARLVESGTRYEEQQAVQAEAAQQLETLRLEKERADQELTAAREQRAGLESKLSAQESNGNEQAEQHRQALAALQKTVDELRTVQAEAAQQLETLRLEKERADQELTAAREQRAGLESKLSAQESNGNEQAEQHRQALAALQKTVDEQRTVQAEAAQQLETLRLEKERADQELTAAREQRAGLESKLSAQESSGNEQAEQHRQVLEVLQKTVDEQRTVQAEAAQQLETLRLEKERADQELTAARDQLAGLESSGNEQAEQHRQALEALQGTVEEQRTAQAEAAQQLETLRLEKEQAVQELTAVREQLAGLESKLTVQESAQYEQDTGLQQKLAGLLLEKDRLEQELDAAKQQAGELNLSLASMESKRSEQEDKHRTEAESLQRALDEQRLNAEKQLAALEANRQETDKELADTLGKLRFLQNELDARDGAENQQGARLQQESDSLRNELEKTRDQLRVAEERVGALGPEAERLLQELEKTTNELVTIKGVIGEKDVQVGQHLQELARVNEKLKAQEQSWEEETKALHEELKEIAAARAAAEEELKHQRGLLEEVKSGGGDVKALQAELETLTDALEESDKVYDEVMKRAAQSQVERDQQAARVVQLEEKLKVLRQSTPASDAGLEVEKARREKEAAEAQIQGLKQEVSELHVRIEKQGEELRLAQINKGGEEAALRNELQLVREQAESEVERLRRELEQTNERLSAQVGSGSRKESHADELKELEELRLQIKEKELSGAAEVAENEALRRELAELQAYLSGHKQELDESSREQHKLFEEVEDRNSEIDRLKQALDIATVEAEEAEFRREESEAARKQVEEALYQAQKDIESQRTRELVKGELHASPSGTQNAEPTLERAGRKGFMGAVVGALLAFGIADGISIMGGKGEIISGLLGGEWLQRLTQSSSRKISPADISISTRGGSVDGVKPDSPKPEANATEGERKASNLGSKPKSPLGSAANASARSDSGAAESKSDGAYHSSTDGSLRDRRANGNLGPEMVYIPGGTFTMGSELGSFAQDEQPLHLVVLKSFAIGRFEVTFDEYMEFAMATGRDVPGDEGWGRGRRPVINVSWEDAVAYTLWLSDQTGRQYRLPTEAEWEYAAAGGAESYYWWGYKLGEGRANCFNCGSQWDGVSTAPAGSFAANAYGLHSTAGNAMEWVEDCYHSSYTGAPADGSAWVDLDCRDRVVRGGAFSKPGDALRATKRSRQDAQATMSALGFRIVREVN